MKISAKAEYACLAVLELALRDEQSSPIRAIDVAEANGIPQRFLVQILLQLKGAGIVASTRGSAGGYRLSLPPEQISVWDVVQLMDGSQQPNPPPLHGSVGWQILHQAWATVSRMEQQHLQDMTFADLVSRARQNRDGMYYI